MLGPGVKNRDMDIDRVRATPSNHSCCFFFGRGGVFIFIYLFIFPFDLVIFLVGKAYLA